VIAVEHFDTLVFGGEKPADMAMVSKAGARRRDRTHAGLRPAP